MKKTLLKRAMALVILLLVGGTALWAQGKQSERASPPVTATGTVGEAQINIFYSSPAVRGRTIWGKLVPYNVVWRAGANEATIFEVSKDVTVEGQPLRAGRYSLFALPGETEWKFIWNSEVGQWGINRKGEANRDPANDVLTVTVKPRPSPVLAERLRYGITPQGFLLRWENVEVPVRVSEE